MHYDIFQWIGKKSRQDEVPIFSFIALEQLGKWVIRFILPINSPKHKKVVWYIIIVTNYFTQWEEATPVNDFTIDIFT
jgi:hypothetical protein